MEASQTLEREAAGRRNAALGAAAAAALQIAGVAVKLSATSSAPEDGPGAPLELPGFFHDHALGLIAGSALLGLGYLALGLPLVYLFRAAKARRPELPRLAQICAYVGPLALALGVVALQIVITIRANNYIDRGDADYFAARNLTSSGGALVPAAIGQIGAISLGFSFVLINLNAMRVGLLTRFMGVLGIIVGVLFVLPLGTPAPVVQAFWLGAVAYLISGRWPNGVPPAWASGEAEPWPTGAELRAAREERDGAKPEPRDERAGAPKPPVPARPVGPAHASAKKRKRKKRR